MSIESVLDIVPTVIAARGGVASVCAGGSPDVHPGAQLGDTVPV